MGTTLDELGNALGDYLSSLDACTGVMAASTGENVSTEAVLNELADALAGYFSASASSGTSAGGAAAAIPPAAHFEYTGVGFQFVFDRRQHVTALMTSIDILFLRVWRYTSQKSRFIMQAGSKGGGTAGSVPATTHTDLYTFSPDEQDLYREFLREGADRLREALMVYSKGLPFKGYLFDEGVEISEQPADGVGSLVWPAGSFVRVGGQIYRALEEAPLGTEVTDMAYWEAVSGLYATLGKVVYFISTEAALSNNALLDALHSIEHGLYSFVLWRWYNMAGLGEEAAVWYGSFEEQLSLVRKALMRRTGAVRRRVHPW
jgi:hypothetical protein